MNKKKQYSAWFPPEVVKEARDLLAELTGANARTCFSLSIGDEDETWAYDDEEQFFFKYRSKGYHSSNYFIEMKKGTDTVCGLQLSQYGRDVTITIRAPTEQIIASVADVFERELPNCEFGEPKEPERPKVRPRIFLGHGRSRLWMDLKGHLVDHHGYEVVAYESGSRAGHAIRDILDELKRAASFAIMVYTGEDETVDGIARARQNVVHETGLFQGRLGFPRVQVLREDGVELFSNLDGIQWIGFSKGNIRETYGDVLAALRREFGDAR